MSLKKMKDKKDSKDNKEQTSKCDIHLRSEEVQELMGEIPPLVQRIGITVIFVIVMALLGVCAFMKCPENVQDGKVIFSNYTILEKIFER